jgi:hypothetical protein
MAGIESGVQQLEAVPEDVAKLPLLQHLEAVMPAADLVLGGCMLVVIVLIHAAGVRLITNHVVARSAALMRKPSAWHADLLVSSSVFLLLALHLFEMVIWVLVLIYTGLVTDWRTAGFFAGNTYTTLGYGNFVLPNGWRMLAPIIAISGLFTFGWSGSVLVDLVGRCQKIKEAAHRS